MHALEDTITVAPAVGEKEPSVFFVVDRTAYRPTQSLHFAGFLRRLNAAGEFDPIANTEVDVQLVSQQKQTKAFQMQLTSDEHGKIIGSYVFSDADALDTYTLQIPGYKGSAKLLLGEYRKSKIRLKISGDVKDEKLDLKFETVDFLDKPVRRVQAQLHRPGRREDQGRQAAPAQGRGLRLLHPARGVLVRPRRSAGGRSAAVDRRQRPAARGGQLPGGRRPVPARPGARPGPSRASTPST